MADDFFRKLEQATSCFENRCKGEKYLEYRVKKTPRTTMMISWSWWNIWAKSINLPIHTFFLSFFLFYYSMGSSRKAPFWHWNLNLFKVLKGQMSSRFVSLHNWWNGWGQDREQSNFFSPNVLVLHHDMPVFFVFLIYNGKLLQYSLSSLCVTE